MKQSTKCMFGLHDWTKWEPKDYQVIKSVNGLEVQGTAPFQDRVCKCCGLRESRRL